MAVVPDARIRQLNFQYRGKNTPTDVLSFPAEEPGYLGDVVIAPAVAARNDPEAPERELRLLVVHGVLHLLGYDHEEDDERAEMWARQERYSGVEVP